jgi:hypothetical protein
MFDTEKESNQFFLPREDNIREEWIACGISSEQCECCHRWTLSQADNLRDGGIVGAWVLFGSHGEEIGVLFDRVCEKCCRLSEPEAEQLAIDSAE